MNFGGVEENVIIREEFPLEKAREILKDETIAVLGYGVQGPGQSMNLRDNGFNVDCWPASGQDLRQGSGRRLETGRNSLSLSREAAKRATIVMCLSPMLL